MWSLGGLRRGNVVVPGTQLGQYRIVEQVGRGGMATVYKAFQPALNRYVAVKILPSFYAEDAQFLERFRQEAQTVSQLRHPNILAVFDFGEQDGTTYMVSEFLAGGTLVMRGIEFGAAGLVLLFGLGLLLGYLAAERVTCL